MTPDADPPGPDDERVSGAEAADAAGGQEGDGQTAPARQTRGKLKKAAKTRLTDTGDLMVAVGQKLEVVVRGSGERDPKVLGNFLTRIDKLFEELDGAQPLIGTLAVAESIHVVLEPPQKEVDRAEEAWKAAAELEEDDPKRERLLREAVAPTVLAADLAIDLIEQAITDEPVENVLAYGRGAAETLRSIARLLADEGLEIEAVAAVQGDQGRAVRATSVSDEQLERVAARLEDLGTMEVREIPIAGVVTMADSDQKRFRLKIAEDTKIPPLLRNVRNRRIQGPYTGKAGRVLEEQGLWSREVVATIRVERQRRETTGKMRPPKYTLIDARPRYE